MEFKFLAPAAVDALLWNNIYYHFARVFGSHQVIESDCYFRWQFARPLPGSVLCWLTFLSRISRMVFSSFWQTLSEIFLHKYLSQKREILPSATSNPHLQKGVGILVICFLFQRYVLMRSLSKKNTSRTLNYYNFILKSDLKITWHPFQDKHLLSVTESLFAFHSQNPREYFAFMNVAPFVLHRSLIILFLILPVKKIIMSFLVL